MEVGEVTKKAPMPEHDREGFRKAALEFEGMLLAAFLQSWQHTGPFSDDKDESTGNDTMQSIAIQATGQELAKRGLLGIADMVEKCLVEHKVVAEKAPSSPLEVQPEPSVGHPPAD